MLQASEQTEKAPAMAVVWQTFRHQTQPAAQPKRPSALA
ncbi:MAG: hypothetical protein RLZZ597_3715 [Cyanobacteriota bacterium]|jgi:hypothetical protein